MVELNKIQNKSALFPLYYQIEESDIKPNKTWNQLCSIITQLPTSEAENIYLLILHHAHISESSEWKDIFNKKLPYKGKAYTQVGNELSYEPKGALYRLENLPVDLQILIGKYVTMITE